MSQTTSLINKQSYSKKTILVYCLLSFPMSISIPLSLSLFSFLSFLLPFLLSHPHTKNYLDLLLNCILISLEFGCYLALHQSLLLTVTLCFNEIELKFLKAPLMCSLAVLNKASLSFKYSYSRHVLFVRCDFMPGSRVLRTQILNARHSDTNSCRVPKIMEP